MKNRIYASLFATAIVASSSLLYIACGDDTAVTEPKADASVADGNVNPGDPDGGDGGKDCFDNPTTHFEIINACTTATKIMKNPTLPKLLPDGGLPPLL